MPPAVPSLRERLYESLAMGGGMAFTWGVLRFGMVLTLAGLNFLIALAVIDDWLDYKERTVC